jgi:PKD repeat protein
MRSILIILALALAPLTTQASSGGVAQKDIDALIARVQKHHDQILKRARSSSSLLSFYVSPESPVQGDSVTIFSEVETDFTGQETILLGTLDGQSINLQQPSADLFLYNAGTFGVIGKHTFQGSYFIQNHSDAVSLRNSIAQMNAQIVTIQAQIQAATDPAIISQLTAQLNQAQSQQAQLTASLANLRTLVAQPSFDFYVAANTASPSFPHISGISPNVVGINSPHSITISGTNFASSPLVTLGGQSVTVTSSTATSIVGTAPAFSAAGPEDLVVSFGSGNQASNAEFKNGFFVSAVSLGNPNPTAVASAAPPSIALGSLASFVSTGSADSQGGTLSYQWQFLSKPAGSALATPAPGTASTYSFTPDSPGTYVVSLITTSSSSGLSSPLSLAYVNVQAPTNQQPVLAPASFTVFPSGTKTVQLQVTDELWQAHSYRVTTSPFLGTASVSATGLLTYTAGAAAGFDSIGIAVFDNGTPPLSGLISIPVTVTQNHAPVSSAPPITAKPGIAGTSRVNAFDRDSGQTLSYIIVAAPSHGTASISSAGLVTYTSNAGYVGNDNLVVSVMDNGLPSMSAGTSIPVIVSNLNPTVLPTVVGSRTFTTSTPVTMGIGFNAASTQTITSPNGAISSVVWDFGDGTKEFVSDRQWAGVNHNYADEGTYNAVLTATDSAGLTASITSVVTVVSQEIPVVRVTMSPSNGGAAPLNVTFDASASTYSAGIGAFHWQFCGLNPEVVTTGPTITHSFTGPCSVRVRAFANGSNSATGQSTISVPVGSGFIGASPSSQFTLLGTREVVLGQALNFDSSRSIDPNVGVTLSGFNWNFNDPLCGSACTSTLLSPSHTYSVVGSSNPTLTVTNSYGFTNTSSVQVAAIVRAGTHTPRSILTASSTFGVAPLTVNFNAGSSYGYDGATIQAYSVSYGDGSPAGTTGLTSHTFSAPGVYIVSGTVTDTDGNSAFTSLTITATSSRDEVNSVGDTDNTDPDREAQRDLLAGACAQNDGASCYALSQMFAEDGDAYTAEVLKEKACGLGYQFACSVK